jgi:anti-sigma factor RsiW
VKESGMIERSEQRQEMARYLLGEMSDQERTRFEEQYAADRDLFDELVDVENDLVDSYANGRLTEAERKQFESYYLATPKRRARAELAKSLASYFSSIDQTGSVRNRQEHEFPGNHGFLHSSRIFPAMRIAAVLVLCAALPAGMGLLWISNRQLGHELAKMQAEQARLLNDANLLHGEIAALTRQLHEVTANSNPHTGVPQDLTEVALLTLSPVARSGEEENKLVISPGITRARLQLKLDQRRYMKYGVSLETPEGVPIWQNKALKSIATREHGRVVAVELPAGMLKSGDYILKLSGATASGREDNVDAYAFRATRP